jgi:hypothetical protein
MKFKTLLKILLLTTPLMVFGQDCVFFYPEMEGAELTYQQFDKKGEVNGSIFQKVSKYKKNSEGAEATILLKTFDKKDKQISESYLEVSCKEGIFYFDMRGYINQQMVSAYEDMEVSVETESLELPGKLNVGDVLKDGFLTMEISNSGIKIMTMKISINDRKVESKESVSTKAGTFECYKISSLVTTRTPIKMEVNSVEWFSIGTGMIKSESYSANGKFMGKSELADLKM